MRRASGGRESPVPPGGGTGLFYVPEVGNGKEGAGGGMLPA